jgi:hypothetical protein
MAERAADGQTQFHGFDTLTGLHLVVVVKSGQGYEHANS